MLTLENIIYQIGSKSHFILFVTSILILHFKTKFLTIFLIGSFVNALINYLLKGLIGQPRPGDETVELEKTYGKIFDFNRFGMPSGHTQVAFFSMVFVYLATQDIRVLAAYFLVSMMVIFQRVNYGHHYLTQTLVGAIVGGILAWAFFEYGVKVHKGHLEKKQDDYYFGTG